MLKWLKVLFLLPACFCGWHTEETVLRTWNLYKTRCKVCGKSYCRNDLDEGTKLPWTPYWEEYSTRQRWQTPAQWEMNNGRK